MKVYISGPISLLPWDLMQKKFADAKEHLDSLGHEPVSPLDIPGWKDCSCLTQEGAYKHEWSCYMRGDLAVMLECDAIYMLSGWPASHGARLELAVAAAVGLQVWHEA